MTDPFPTDPTGAPAPNPFRRSSPAPLPAWLARRLLRPGEQVVWVRGPRWTPEWERTVTDPTLFLAALVLGGACVAVGTRSAASVAEMPPGPFLAAMGIVLGSVYLLGICAAYFTRLVVTNHRVFMCQGREVCKSWGLHQLPPSLVRFVRRDDGQDSKTVDLDALESMLGGPSDQFSDSKTIVAFGKKLDGIKPREDRRF